MSPLGPEASSTNAKLGASSPLLGFDLSSFVEAAHGALEADKVKGQAMPNRRRRGTSIPNSLLASVRQEVPVETKEKNEQVARTKELRAWGKGEAWVPCEAVPEEWPDPPSYEDIGVFSLE